MSGNRVYQESPARINRRRVERPHSQRRRLPTTTRSKATYLCFVGRWPAENLGQPFQRRWAQMPSKFPETFESRESHRRCTERRLERSDSNPFHMQPQSTRLLSRSRAIRFVGQTILLWLRVATQPTEKRTEASKARARRCRHPQVEKTLLSPPTSIAPSRLVLMFPVSAASHNST
jgi:hypothetical protein